MLIIWLLWKAVVCFQQRWHFGPNQVREWLCVELLSWCWTMESVHPKQRMYLQGVDFRRDLEEEVNTFLLNSISPEYFELIAN